MLWAWSRCQAILVLHRIERMPPGHGLKMKVQAWTKLGGKIVDFSVHSRTVDVADADPQHIVAKTIDATFSYLEAFSLPVLA